MLADSLTEGTCDVVVRTHTPQLLLQSVDGFVVHEQNLCINGSVNLSCSIGCNVWLRAQNPVDLKTDT